MAPPHPVIQLPYKHLGGYRVVAANQQELQSVILQRMALRKVTALVYANANMVVQCAPWHERFDDPRVIVANDGVAMDLAARWLCGGRFPSNLNGTDFTPYMLEHCGRPMRLFLYGARPASIEGAARALQAMGHEVVGQLDGYTVLPEGELIARLRAAEPDIVLVALGNPRQERWIIDHLDELPPAVYTAVGAYFDFLSGLAPRAPRLVRMLRLEWAFRLSLEPRRLLRRYTVGGYEFFRQCWRERHSSARNARATA
ncbi:MAG: hypothetical protein RLY78_1924 [Pseudomonadota bacterium]|jgi:beta-1,4-glucosyltransferase